MSRTVAIIGRPNVGKSTLFNRLVGRRLAIVEPTPGVTRDWKEGDASIAGLAFRLLDTPGLEEAREGTVEASMRIQSERALDRADIALMVFDAREGITPLDTHFARWLRECGKPVILVANKCEARMATAGAFEGFELGMGEPVMISAEHGQGMADLYDALQPLLEEGETAPDALSAGQPEDEDDEAVASGPLRLAVIGRPNVGKSTLVNRLLGEDRVLTGPEPGMTRDAVHIDWAWKGKPVRLVDTAGLRRRANVHEKLERLSVAETERAIRLAQVVVLVVNATVMLERQDLYIARRAAEEGRAIVIAANKWDLIDDPGAALRRLHDRIGISLPQIKGVQTVGLSALTGQNTDRLLRAVFSAFEVWNARVPTGELNRWLAALLEHHPPPAVHGRRLRLRYMTQIKSRPPTFVLFGSRPDQLPGSYLRYLENGLREDFGLTGTPIRINVRAGHNPYAPD